MMPERTDIHLAPNQVESLFPFYFIVDRSMNLVGVGRSLAKLDASLCPGRPVRDFMQIVGTDDPPMFDAVAGRARTLCVIHLRSKRVVLRGQFKCIHDADTLLFVGSPWLTDAAALAELGLELNDFAVHDPAIDLLLLMQGQTTSLADARRLADVLTKQRAELRQANTRLAAQEAESRKLAMIAARTDNAVILTDAKGRIEWVNDGFTRLTGYALAEVLGRTPGSCLQGSGSDLETVRRMSELIREGQGFRERVLNVAKDGISYWVLIDAEPIHNADGVVTNFMAIERDVTQEHLATLQSARLNTLNEITRQIVESFLQDHDLSHSINMILARVGEFLDVSRSYLFRYRQYRQRLSNTHEWCASGVTPRAHSLRELQGGSFPWLTGMLGRNEAVVLDDVVAQAHPEVQDLLVAQQVRALLVLPVIINDQLEAFIGFADIRRTRHWRSEEVALLRTMVESLSRAIERRISERERAHAAVQIRNALKRAESANELKSAFLASMSHELRTPMTAIMGFAHLLRRVAGSAQDRNAWADSIVRNADHLLALLNDLLDLSKIEAGQLTVVAEPCDPAQIVADVVNQLRPLAAEKTLPIELVIEAAPTITTTDSLRLRQIAFNLISNAIRYTDSGAVRVHVCNRISHRAEAITITVSDTGIGIPADKHELLFLPFSQVHPNAPLRGGGVGLGLNISRRLAELLGGSLTFTSASGVGSQFVVTLPVIVPRTSELPKPRPEAGRAPLAARGLLSGASILVVEDSPDNRQLLTYLLLEAGARVTNAEDGRQACDLCLQNGRTDSPFDVILMDMQMPVMDGYSATERLRRSGVSTPILALTAFAMADDRDRCLRAGCDDYLSKPIDEAALLQKLAAHCNPDPGTGAKPVGPPPHHAELAPEAPTPGTTASPVVGVRPHWLEALISDFKGTLPAVQAQLVHAIESRNFQAAAQIAHRLRGVAANFRLLDLATAAGAFEDEYRTDDQSPQLPSRSEALVAAVLAAIPDATDQGAGDRPES